MAKTSQPKKNKPRLSKARLSKEIEARLSAFVNSSIEGFVLLDENLNCIDINPAGAGLLAMSREDLMGKNIEDVVPGIRESGRYEKYLSVIRTGALFFAENIVPHPKFGDLRLSVKAFKVGNGLGLIVQDITERKRVEKALSESEERFRLLFERAPFGYQSLNEEGYFIEINQAWLDLLGYLREEVIGRWFGDFLAPGYQEHFEKNFPRFKAAGEIHGVEFEMMRKDGSQVTVAFDGRIVYDEHGKFKQTHCVLQNITERKKVDEILRQSERNYRVLFEGTLDGLFVVSAETGRIVLANRSAAKMFGFSSPEAMIGVYPINFFTPENRDGALRFVAEDVLRDLSEEGSRSDCEVHEIRALANDGREIWLEIQGTPAEYQGKLAYLVSSRDITERKQAEEALRAAEVKYQIVADNTYDWEFWINTEGRFVYVSPSCKRITGHTAAEFEANPELLTQITHPEDRVGLLAHLHDAVKTETSTSISFRVIRPDGTERWIECVCQSVFDSNGKFIGHRGSSRDITEHKQAEGELRESENRYRGLSEVVFDGIVIHEKGKIIEATEKYAQLFGYELSEIIGKDLLTLVTPEYRNSVRTKMISGYTKTYEVTGLRKDGTTFSLEVHALDVEYRGRKARVGVMRDITERKKAEEALGESEEKYRNLFNTAEVALFRSRIEGGKILECNDLLAKLFGYDSREQCIAEHVTSEHYVDPNVRPQILTQMLEKGEVENFEAQVTRRDGTLFWVSYSAHIHPERGYIEGAIVDITERKKLEEQERRHSHDLDLLSKAAMSLVELHSDADIYHFIAERLREFAEGSSILVNSFDEASNTFCLREALATSEQMKGLTKILGFNLIGMSTPISDEAMQGLSSGELEQVQGGVYDLASGAIPMPVCREMEKLLEVGSVHAIGFHWAGRLYGSAVILMRNRTELRNKDVIETFVKQVSIAMQRRQAEEALTESEEKYRALIEAAGRAGEGIIIIQDREEREAAFVFVNDEFCKMSGYAREELLNRSAWDLIPYEIAARLKDWYKLRHMGEALPGHYEAAGVRKDGTIVPLDLSVITMPWQGKIATVIYMRDITERKRMEEALRESEQTIRRLAKAAASAHEEERHRVSLEVHDRISQTLTATFHQLQALEAIPIENAEAQHILKRASDLLQESIRESRNIMEDLYSPVLSDFGIVAVIDEELRRFQEETGCLTKFDKRCAVRPTPEVESTVYRIFHEALNNVKRHAIPANEVKVSFFSEAGVVSLQVEDNGPGFDVEAAMLNKRVGGLKGMQRRAELGGGTFEVVSSPGHGTTVTVRLPCTLASDGGKPEKTT